MRRAESLQPSPLASTEVFPDTWSKYFDRSVSQDLSSPLLALKRSSVGYLWQGNGTHVGKRKERCTYRSIRQDRYDFDKSRHSGSLLPRWDLMHRRYESMILLHSSGM